MNCYIESSGVATWFDRLERTGKTADQLIAELAGSAAVRKTMAHEIRRADDLRREWPRTDDRDTPQPLRDQITADRASTVGVRLAIQCMEHGG
ncbi:hypothetical protein [Caballeronia sp. GAWG2-1]|uniref:hypothetical protein n=1 Tax=Caballeronia sp. GAWG2-1 TaxID=2921744 RepID=UPI0020279CD8|nr:hypothetical protein [Caballeronia sp. GAWG2-1]